MLGEIRSLWSRHGPLNVNAIRALDEQLYRAALKRYRSWYSAVREAGLPWEEAAPVGKAWSMGRPVLTEDDIVQAIRERALEGLSVAWKEFQDNSLVLAARALYGSWPAALLCAGVPVEELPQCRATKAVTILAVRQLLARGLMTEGAATRAGYRRWVRECGKHFGSWDKAVHWASAHPPERRMLEVRLQSRLTWSPDRVLEELRKLASPEGSVAARAIRDDAGLRTAVKRHYRTVAAAVRAAGLTLSHEKRRAYSKGEVRALIRDAADAEGVIRVRDLSPSVLAAARRHFGSYEEACRAAGGRPLGHKSAPGAQPSAQRSAPVPLPPGLDPVSLEQAAAAAGRALGTVYSALKAGKLEAVEGGLTRASVESWTEGLGVAAGPDWLRPAEAAGLADCPVKVVETAFREGRLTGQRTSTGRALIARASFDAWLAERPPVQEQEGLTIAQVVELTGLSRATIYKAVMRGELAAVKVRRPGDKAAGYIVLPGVVPGWLAEWKARHA